MSPGSMTSHANRSWTGRLALCRGAGIVRPFREFRCQPVVIQPSGAQRCIGSLVVRSDIRVLDILPTRLAASDIDNGPEVRSYQSRSGRSEQPAKAEQPSHGRHTFPGHSAIGFAPESGLAGARLARVR